MPIYEGQWQWPTQSIRLAIVVSRFNESISQLLLDGALAAFRRMGLAPQAVDTIWVPGAFEIAGTVKRLWPRYNGFVTLGAVIRGETPHFDYVAGACAHGVAALANLGEKPVIFGVLTCNTPEEAQARAGGKAGNKGSEAALAALEMISLYHQLSEA